MPRLSRKNRQTVLGIVLLGVAIAVVGAIGAFLYRAEKEKLPLDKETLCPIEGPRSITALILDLTDPFTLTQREALSRKLIDIKDELEVHGMIAVYVIQPVIDKLISPLVTICNPGRGKDIDPIIANPRRVEQKWQEQFSQPLEKLINETIRKPNSDSFSPILEDLKSIAISSFTGKSKKNIKRNLIIVSDMIQHSPSLNHYTGVKPFSSFQQSNDFITLRSDLRDVDASIIYVRRSTAAKIQGKAHIEFWQNYFSAMGANLTDVTSLD